MKDGRNSEYFEESELARYNAEPWMIDCLDLNPEYTCWGPGDDYMSAPKHADRYRLKGWGDAPMLTDNVIIPHFYFELRRDNRDCEHCHGTGQNPETYELDRTFYDFEGTGKRWCDKITQDEVDALIENKRLSDLTRGGHHPTAEEVNAWERGRKGIGHDAINRWILIETRAKRLGVYGDCEHCDRGTVYLEDIGHLSLCLWYLDTDTGISNGWHLERIEKNELPEVMSFLKECSDRNASFFANAEKSLCSLDGISPTTIDAINQPNAGWHAPGSELFDGGGWSAPADTDNKLPWLDDLNEVATFHFEKKGKKIIGHFWVLHPRKGATRIWTCDNINEQLDSVVDFLAKVAERNRDRFAGPAAIAETLKVA